MQRFLAYNLLTDLRTGKLIAGDEATSQHLRELGTYLSTFITQTCGQFAADWDSGEYERKAAISRRRRGRTY